MQLVALRINLFIVRVAVVRHIRVSDLVRARMVSHIAWQWLLFDRSGERTTGAQRNDEARQMHGICSIGLNCKSPTIPTTKKEPGNCRYLIPRPALVCLSTPRSLHGSIPSDPRSMYQ
jgi:hypothetical protein